MKLRPYKPCDGDQVAGWLTDEKIFAMWCAGKYRFPMTGPCEWRGGARHCSRAMVGESGLETC